jgi:hypothetical protein
MEQINWDCFRECIGCKNKNTTVEKDVVCKDGEMRKIVSCDFCGGRFFLPNDKDKEVFGKTKHPHMFCLAHLANLMRAFPSE